MALIKNAFNPLKYSCDKKLWKVEWTSKINKNNIERILLFNLKIYLKHFNGIQTSLTFSCRRKFKIPLLELRLMKNAPALNWAWP